MIVLDSGCSAGTTAPARSQAVLPEPRLTFAVDSLIDAMPAALQDGDGVTGMAAAPADLAHRGVTYDLEVDTTHTTPAQCARTVAGRLGA
ncbi:hypothetical protein E1212_12650 [Jiangella ureilytica]|uniref:Uncharacterized protein n=1 Tax=Jiangella ureilytica TaxID=2530374 RepID=A0A4V2XWZ3_9ACTN|nr:hypothetical protein E1212_12650 [Jiangella ureilytica]